MYLVDADGHVEESETTFSDQFLDPAFRAQRPRVVAVDQMADRIESLESILDADHPNWRQERGGQNKKEV